MGRKYVSMLPVQELENNHQIMQLITIEIGSQNNQGKLINSVSQPISYIEGYIKDEDLVYYRMNKVNLKRVFLILAHRQMRILCIIYATFGTRNKSYNFTLAIRRNTGFKNIL